MTHTEAMMPLADNVSPAQLRRLHDILRGLPKDASANALRNGVCQVELSAPSYASFQPPANACLQ